MSNISLTRLSYNNQVVGVRINLNHGQKLYDIGTTLEVVENALKFYDLNYKKLNYIEEGRLKGNTIVFSNDNKAVELKSKEELARILKQFLNHSKKLTEIQSNFMNIILSNIEIPLVREGITSFEQEYNDKELCYSCRFLGGYDAWSGSEDICDADILSDKVWKALKSVVDKFNKKYKVNARVTVGEKAWIYVYVE